MAVMARPAGRLGTSARSAGPATIPPESPPDSMTTVTMIPPGLTASAQPGQAWPGTSGPALAAVPFAGLLRLSVTVASWPDVSVPGSGVTVTAPRPDPSVTDQLTGPPTAVRVKEPVGCAGLSVIVVALTPSVPGATGVLVELGRGLVLDGLGEAR